MTTTEMKDILVQRGYNEKNAELVSNELFRIDSHLIEPLELWLANQKETEVIVEGVSLFALMHRNKLKYPAALLSIDWIYKEPEKALSLLKNFK